MTSGTPLLQIHALTKRFGGLTAVDNVNYAVAEREIKGIIGPNGAGKTTLFNLITGELRLTAGKVFLRGEEITSLAPHVICRRGLGRTFQLTFIFPDMTVFDCVWAGAYSKMTSAWGNLFFSRVRRSGAVAEKAVEICRLVGLEDRMDELGSNLSYGDQKVLEIAMALSTEPKILLLDEPTQGVGPQEAEAIVALVERLSERMAVVLIEHNIDIILRVCHNITVLSMGRVLAEGNCEEIGRNEEVQRIYLGMEQL
jgi:branched-chain amino acid transport system ATP-binding protein